MNYRQIELELPVGRVHALHNDTHSETRVLCLHGWLDNHASFLPMLPCLQEVECVAVDLIGHGRSARRESGAFYHYIDYVRDIKLITDALQWQSCHLLGHSMGGSLSMMACNAYPDLVQSLCMIDTLHPMTRAPAEGPALFAQAMQQITRWDNEREKIYKNLDDAVKARLAASPFDQTPENARLLMQYATEQTSQGYRLLSDTRLGIRSPIMLSEAQLKPFIETVTQPILAVLGKNGLIRARKKSMDFVQLFRCIRVEEVEGGHHLHMEHPERVAGLYLDFMRSLR